MFLFFGVVYIIVRHIYIHIHTTLIQQQCHHHNNNNKMNHLTRTKKTQTKPIHFLSTIKTTTKKKRRSRTKQKKGGGGGGGGHSFLLKNNIYTLHYNIYRIARDANNKQTKQNSKTKKKKKHVHGEDATPTTGFLAPTPTAMVENFPVGIKHSSLSLEPAMVLFSLLGVRFGSLCSTTPTILRSRYDLLNGEGRTDVDLENPRSLSRASSMMEVCQSHTKLCHVPGRRLSC